MRLDYQISLKSPALTLLARPAPGSKDFLLGWGKWLWLGRKVKGLGEISKMTTWLSQDRAKTSNATSGCAAPDVFDFKRGIQKRKIQMLWPAQAGLKFWATKVCSGEQYSQSLKLLTIDWGLSKEQNFFKLENIRREKGNASQCTGTHLTIKIYK